MCRQNSGTYHLFAFDIAGRDMAVMALLLLRSGQSLAGLYMTASTAKVIPNITAVTLFV